MLSGMLTTESQEGVGLVTKEHICYKRAMETQPLLKVTIPNIVDDSLLNS
jgi:GTPase